MRRRLSGLCALSLLALALSALPAGAVPGDCYDVRPATETKPAVTACQVDTWFHQAQTKVGNLGGQQGQGFPSWDTTKPSASVTAGAGGAYPTVAAIDAFEENNSLARPSFVGSFDGVIDSMGLRFYVYSPAPQMAGQFPFILRVDIDGQTVWNNYDTAETAPLTNGAQPYEPARFDVTLTGIAKAMERNGMRLDGPHTIEVSVINYYFGDGHTVFVYDTSEVPSGIAFNRNPTDPALTASHRISAA